MYINRYKKTFLILGVLISLPLLMLSVIDLLHFRLMGFAITGQFIILWWGLYFYLRTKSKPAFWFSFAWINLCWWPLMFRIVRIGIYLGSNTGSEKTDNSVFLRAFTDSMLFETAFFVPLTVAMVFGLLVIRDFYKTSKSDQTSGLNQPE